MKKLIYILLIIITTLSIRAESLFFISENATVIFNNNVTVIVNGDIAIDTGAILSQKSGSHFYLPGNLINNGSIESGSSQISFFRNEDLNISGSGTTQFSTVNIDFDSETNSLTLEKDTDVTGDLNITTGIFNLQTHTADSPVASSGIFNLSANSQVRISGVEDMLDVLNNYATYNIDAASIFNFYGGNQTISNVPGDFDNNIGFGIVTLQNAGTKLVSNPLIIRGNLYISDDATLLNDVGIDALSVRQSIINSATVNNKGIIEIGQ